MAFEPKYTISHKLLKILADTAVLREKIINLPILPKREVILKSSARLRMVHSSTAIEGNLLSLREVKDVLQGKVVTGIGEKERLEVINYERVMDFIDKLARKDSIFLSEKLILNFHKLLTKNILAREKCGCYRKNQVYVVSRFTNKVVYKPPSAKFVPKLMNDLANWYKSKNAQEISPVITAGIIHYQLVTIHPFADGNGRLARALATFILYAKGYDIKKLFALEDYYNLNRANYYNAIQESRDKKDLTLWLEYFSEGLLLELKQVYEKVDHFSKEAKIFGKEPVYLARRLRDILDFAALNGKIFRSDVVEAFTVSPRTAHRDLRKLVNLGFLKTAGKGPKTHYII